MSTPRRVPAVCSAAVACERADRCLPGSGVWGRRLLALFALFGSSVCRSGGQSRMGEGEFMAQQVCRGYGHLDAADRPTDPGADFAQGEPQLGRQQMAAAEDVER